MDSRLPFSVSVNYCMGTFTNFYIFFDEIVEIYEPIHLQKKKKKK